MVTFLFLGANPSDQTRLALTHETREIKERLQRTPLRKDIDFVEAWATRAEQLQGLLLRRKPALLHFSGHGSKAGQILVEDEQGATAPISAEALAGLFQALPERPRCVVLNACYSARQAAG